MVDEPILVGAVAYDPKVVTIWEIIKAYFIENGCSMDYVFYSNYELQAEALVGGQIDIAWNSPLAWLDSQRLSNDTCRAIAMRDTDRDRVSHIVVCADSGIERIDELAGRTVATGAKDSPQATLIPLGLLQRHELVAGKDFTVMRHDVLVGKHGDHLGGEKDAFTALKEHRADASCVLDLNWTLWTSDGTADLEQFRVLATTDRFDHCVFTVAEEFDDSMEKQWLDVLNSMTYDNPSHREMMDMEGLKKWMPGRTSGFGPLTEAVTKQRYFG
jgi:phosphonate transport system substrate-binding protein